MIGPVGDPIRRDDAPGSVVVLARDLQAAGRSRRWLRGVLAGQIEGRQLDDACLVVSELVTNALRYGLGDIVVHTAVDGHGRVRVSVTDWSDGAPVLLPPDPARVGGVGLRIVDGLTDGWGVASFPGGKTVWAAVADPATARGERPGIGGRR